MRIRDWRYQPRLMALYRVLTLHRLLTDGRYKSDITLAVIPMVFSPLIYYYAILTAVGSSLSGAPVSAIGGQYIRNTNSFRSSQTLLLQ